MFKLFDGMNNMNKKVTPTDTIRNNNKMSSCNKFGHLFCIEAIKCAGCLWMLPKKNRTLNYLCAMKLVCGEETTTRNHSSRNYISILM